MRQPVDQHFKQEEQFVRTWTQLLRSRVFSFDKKISEQSSHFQGDSNFESPTDWGPISGLDLEQKATDSFDESLNDLICQIS